MLVGIILSLVGIVFCGWAGALRERGKDSSQSVFSFKKGVPLAVMAGVLSAIYNYSIMAGEPLGVAAVAKGASKSFMLNAVLPFACGGAWVTNVIWCAILIARNRTGSQLIRLSCSDGSSLGFYYLMSVISGAFWYFQFFFYGIAHYTFMGEEHKYTSWAIHMALLILFSNLYGWLFKEWAGSSNRPRNIVLVGMLIIIVATLIIAYGNHLDEKMKEKEAEETKSQSVSEKQIDPNLTSSNQYEKEYSDETIRYGDRS